MFKKVLIANRGEVAMRVIRACRELGVGTVAVHSEADAQALHVRFADEAVCIGPPSASASYLNVPAIISAAEITAADALHPGYGFLSENAQFAEIVERCGLTWIGPTPEAIRRWGDKHESREMARRFGLPVLPGSGLLRDVKHAASEAGRIGFPLIIKAVAGGGGRGMRIVRRPEELSRAFEAASAEARQSFVSGELILERYLEEPRHIEYQILADQQGNVRTLGERECSLQRRHQKLVEEAPSPVIDAERREALGDRIRHAIRETGYSSLGTLEFLMDADGELYFMEMNTRLQVEHPVTEAVTGIDLVVEQIRAAAGAAVDFPDTREWSFRGHAVECRIMAEDPVTLAPTPGRLTEYHPPGGFGIRVDSGVYGGWDVPPHYDSMLAKVIAHGHTRELALKRMRQALREFIFGGIRTNIALHQRLLDDPEVVEGRMTTKTVERVLDRMRGKSLSG